MESSNLTTKKTIDYSLEDFARFYTGSSRQAILLFAKLVERKQVIPYKIRNKDFSVEVASTTAFTLNLVFHNVLIEDGRHPAEILMDQIRIERETGMFRLRFYNRLKKEDPPKESSFVFDSLTSGIILWNYNFYTQILDENSHKIPWSLLDEPMRALLGKASALGRDSLNEYERKILPAVEFLQVIFDVFLDDQTRIAYGRSNIYYNKELLEGMSFNEQQVKAGLEMMEYFGWIECRQKFLHFSENKDEFFKSFVRQLTQKEGKTLYTWLKGNLSAATSEYPRLKQILPVYAGNHRIIHNCIDKVMHNWGYEGTYPDYRKEKKAAFIEISQVYQRKYTYLNEKKKLELVTFIENIVNGCLTVTAIYGTILGKRKADIYDTAMTAIDGCFTEQGRRRCQVGESLTIDPDMEEGEVLEATQNYVLELVK